MCTLSRPFSTLQFQPDDAVPDRQRDTFWFHLTKLEGKRAENAWWHEMNQLCFHNSNCNKNSFIFWCILSLIWPKMNLLDRQIFTTNQRSSPMYNFMHCYSIPASMTSEAIWGCRGPRSWASRRDLWSLKVCTLHVAA